MPAGLSGDFFDRLVKTPLPESSRTPCVEEARTGGFSGRQSGGESELRR